MKVLLAGATGFAGSEILKQCMAHNYIEKIYVLTRRPLDSQFSHKKVTQILHEDFETYPEELLDRLRDEGVETCIWALGGKTQDLKNFDESTRVNVHFTAKAAEALAKYVAPSMEPYPGYPEKDPKPGVKRFPFRFVYVSGWGAEHDQFKKLWISNDDRKIKGAAEKAILSVAENSEEKGAHKCFEVVVLRPGGILDSKDDAMGTIITQAVIPSVTVHQLARSAIKVAFNGGKDGKTFMENKDLLGEEWAMVNSLS